MFLIISIEDMRINDYILLDDVTKINRSNKYRWKCLICGHEKLVSLKNMEKAGNIHNKKSCKEDYYKKEVLGKFFGDYECIAIDYSNKVGTMKCKVCGNIKYNVEIFKLSVPKFHNGTNCDTLTIYQNKNFEILNSWVEDSKTFFRIKCRICGVERPKVFISNMKSISHKGCKIEYKDRELHEKLTYIWGNMKQRCLKSKHYTNIEVCFKSFDDFYTYVEPMYLEHKKRFGNYRDATIDRIDNNGNYTKGNVRVVSMKMQMCNQRQSLKFLATNLSTQEKYISNSTSLFADTFGLNKRCIGNCIRKKSKVSKNFIFEKLTIERYKKLIKEGGYIEIIRNANR